MSVHMTFCIMFVIYESSLLNVHAWQNLTFKNVMVSPRSEETKRHILKFELAIHIYLTNSNASYKKKMSPQKQLMSLLAL